MSVLRTIERFDVAIQRVSLALNEAGEAGALPAILFLPSTHSPLRSIICLHGRGATKASMLYPCCRLATRGYAALALDLPGHGERPRFRRGADGDDERLRVVETAVHDVRAATDALLSQPEAASTEVALVGFSLGAVVALRAAAADPRVAAVVAFMGAPLSQPEPFTSPTFRADLLLVAGTQDAAFPVEAMARFKAMVADRRPDLSIECRQPDVGHMLTPEVENEAFDWLQERFPPG
jgi:carboxymethylenebutenolidase